MNEFVTHVDRRDGAVVLHVDGDLDLLTSPVLRQALDELRASGARVAVDLTGCTFIDSSGVRTLTTANDAFDDAGLDLSLVCPPGNRTVLVVLDLLGVASVMPVRAELGPQPPGADPRSPGADRQPPGADPRPTTTGGAPPADEPADGS
jgi:anti-sigma B factor antagonist